jgi:hypothetical protein
MWFVKPLTLELRMEDTMSDISTLKQQIAEYLQEQGVKGNSRITDNDLSETLAEAIIDNCLIWIPAKEMSSSSVRSVDAIIGFAFGNRFEPHGNRNAGPINKKLRDLVVEFYNAIQAQYRPPRVWVQWEIGDYISNTDIPPSNLTVLEPEPDIEKDEVKYVSTIKVMQEVSKDLVKKSSILVVAHPDHIGRCVRIVEQFEDKNGKFEYSAIAINHARPPASDWYDDQSGQLWTRTRHLYLLHDMIGRLSMHRQATNKEAKTKGIW